MAQLMKKMNRCKILLITLLVAGSLLGPDTSLTRAVPEREAVDAGWQTKDSGLSQPRRSLNLTKAEQDFLREHPVIQVGNEDDWPPFDFSENGKPRGYAIEHLELLGRKLGISFTYVNGHTWSELLELFQKKQIDVLPSLWISEARKKYMLFTEPFLELPYVIVTPDNHTSVKSFFDLQDMVISVPDDFKQEEVFEAYYPEIELHFVKNALEGLKAISFGQADAYIGYRGVVDHLIASNFLSDLRIVAEVDVPGLTPQGLHIGVRQELPLLHSCLQKAMQTIQDKQKVALAQKWISLDQSGSVWFSPLEQGRKVFCKTAEVDSGLSASGFR